ncbi:hypothetical protein MVEN_01117600 [Mycena venus]|uniref:Ricin B lectin domain-containing protein n=1 Tax=Mycena venus TaxID=2733690 RepID=A0A8H6Y6S3_9AGAR|nr:hypothetical protein MVEN_01117600 [Mycena venus]
MFSSTFIALVAFALSASASQIQSTNPAFSRAGIQGCIAAAENVDGEPLIIHNCDTEDIPNQDWDVSFFDKRNAGPQQIKVFGNKCIDVTGGVNADGTKLQIWTCVDGNKNQLWTSVTDGTFQWSGTNKCIDLTDGKITDGNVLQIYTCNNQNANQKWVGAPLSTGVTGSAQAVHVVGGDSSAKAGGPFCLTAASDTDGAAVTLSVCLDAVPNGNITWTLPVAPLTGQIKTFNNKCLDVPNGSTANGVKLQIWTCTAGNTNQLFQVHASSNGASQIEWSGKGKCMDLTDGKSVSGNPIQLWDCAVPDNNLNQDWTRATL